MKREFILIFTFLFFVFIKSYGQLKIEQIVFGSINYNNILHKLLSGVSNDLYINPSMTIKDFKGGAGFNIGYNCHIKTGEYFEIKFGPGISYNHASFTYRGIDTKNGFPSPGGGWYGGGYSDGIGKINNVNLFADIGGNCFITDTTSFHFYFGLRPKLTFLNGSYFGFEERTSEQIAEKVLNMDGVFGIGFCAFKNSKTALDIGINYFHEFFYFTSAEPLFGMNGFEINFSFRIPNR